MRNGLFDTNRLEAFSDAVIAIMLTIMLLELRAPQGIHFSDLMPILPKFLVYLLSFLYLAIYWNNHHHLFKAAKGINGTIMWSNMGLLFCLSLIPFATSWMGENYAAHAPTVFYGIILMASAIAYYVLEKHIVVTLNPQSPFVKALSADYKGRLSPVIYILAIVLAFINPAFSQVLYAAVALIWIVPDKRIERALN